jgi:hypothetical protein
MINQTNPDVNGPLRSTPHADTVLMRTILLHASLDNAPPRADGGAIPSALWLHLTAFDPSTSARTTLWFGQSKDGPVTIELADGRRVSGVREGESPK